MASMMEDIRNFPDLVAAKIKALSEGISAGVEGTREIVTDIYEVFSAIGSFFAWLGLHAGLLLVGTMILLYLISIISPLDRRVNYLVAMAAGSGLAYWNHFDLDAYGRYMLVMTAPFLVMYTLQLLWLWLKQLVKNRKRLGQKEKEAVMERLLEATRDFQRDGDAGLLKTRLAKLGRQLDGSEPPAVRGDFGDDGEDTAPVRQGI